MGNSEQVEPQTHEHATEAEAHAHGGHSWWMLICCIPMVAIAVALVAAGVVSAQYLLFAALCVGMMALMMFGMGHGHGNR